VRDEPQLVSRTITGTPVYTVSPPADKLVACGRVHNPPARGVLSEYLSGLVPLPACFIIKCGDKFKRIFRVDADGMLFPITLDALPSKEKKKLAIEGIIGWIKKPEKRG